MEFPKPLQLPVECLVIVEDRKEYLKLRLLFLRHVYKYYLECLPTLRQDDKYAYFNRDFKPLENIIMEPTTGECFVN